MSGSHPQVSDHKQSQTESFRCSELQRPSKIIKAPCCVERPASLISKPPCQIAFGLMFGASAVPWSHPLLFLDSSRVKKVHPFSKFTFTSVSHRQTELLPLSRSVWMLKGIMAPLSQTVFRHFLKHSLYTKRVGHRLSFGQVGTP